MTTDWGENTPGRFLSYLCPGGQVSHGQLPLNPPGPEGSKGRWS